MPWKSRRLDSTEKENNQLRTVVIEVRHELMTKSGYADRLEALLRSRTEQVDELANTIAAVTR